MKRAPCPLPPSSVGALSSILIVILLFPGCEWASEVKQQIDGSPHIQQHIEVVVDVSKSLPDKFLVKGLAKMGELGVEWVKTAQTGDSFRAWVLLDEMDQYQCEPVFQFTMPRLGIPAYKCRTQEAKRFMRDLGTSLNVRHFRRTESTPLLSALHLVTTVATGSYDLVIVSDLQQDSSELRMLPEVVNSAPVDSLVRRMSAVCPVPLHVPKSVTCFWWPGLLRPDKAYLQGRERLNRIWHEFFRAWRPSPPEVIFTSL